MILHIPNCMDFEFVDGSQSLEPVGPKISPKGVFLGAMEIGED